MNSVQLVVQVLDCTTLKILLFLSYQTAQCIASAAYLPSTKPLFYPQENFNSSVNNASQVDGIAKLKVASEAALTLTTTKTQLKSEKQWLVQTFQITFACCT